MVNLSISGDVAESLVFHQGGDTLTHILELIWTPGVFSKFAVRGMPTRPRVSNLAQSSPTPRAHSRAR
jgi:hypothetical protein